VQASPQVLATAPLPQTLSFATSMPMSYSQLAALPSLSNAVAPSSGMPTRGSMHLAVPPVSKEDRQSLPAEKLEEQAGHLDSNLDASAQQHKSIVHVNHLSSRGAQRIVQHASQGQDLPPVESHASGSAARDLRGSQSSMAEHLASSGNTNAYTSATLQRETSLEYRTADKAEGVWPTEDRCQ
jgi:hypothetical protein